MLHYEKSCGAIVYRKFHGNIELLLIKNVNGGHWAFPKGHVENEETEEETALREIKEETGIDVVIDSSFHETITYSPKKDVTKDVVYFIAKAINYDYIPQTEEVFQIKWVEINLAKTMLIYDNVRQLVAKAKNIIKDSY